jgi:hypothetical protein
MANLSSLMRSLDPVALLVECHRYRIGLLDVRKPSLNVEYAEQISIQLASELGIRDDPRVPNAIKSDELDICVILHKVLKLDTGNLAERLDEDCAEKLMDLVQKV